MMTWSTSEHVDLLFIHSQHIGSHPHNSDIQIYVSITQTYQNKRSKGGKRHIHTHTISSLLPIPPKLHPNLYIYSYITSYKHIKTLKRKDMYINTISSLLHIPPKLHPNLYMYIYFIIQTYQNIEKKGKE